MSVIVEGPYNQFTPPVQRGLSTPFCRKQTGRWSPVNGWTFDQAFSGLSYAQMQALANLYANDGIEYELTLQNGIASLTTRDTTGNTTIDVWEINASQVTVSWLKNPFLLNALYIVAAAYTQSSNQAVLDWNVTRFCGKMAAGIANQTSPFDLVKPASIADATGVFSSQQFFDGVFTFGSISPTVYLPIFRFYQRALAGQDVFFADQYSLRHTTNASNRGYFNVADVDVNCIYTPAQLYSEITNSQSWLFPCPAEIMAALADIFNGLGVAPPNYLQGALKGGSSRVTAANNRVNIVTEYQLFNWNTDDYALAV
jgi:hypothetical protein